MHDNTTEPGPSGGKPQQANQHAPGAPAEQPIYPEDNTVKDIGTAHERMQQRITTMLIGLLALLMVLTALMYGTTRWTQMRDSDIRDFMNHFAAPLLTLLATAVGFYFADRRK